VERLAEFGTHVRACFRTKTHDGSEYGLAYVRGQLRLEDGRTFAGIAREAGVTEQNMQHFMTYSPWDAGRVTAQVQHDIAGIPALSQGGALLIDESADEKDGQHSAGAGRQHNGRLGKIEMSQVGVFAAYAHAEQQVWTWVDGALFMPQAWFDDTDEAQARRNRAGMPPERIFQTKIELAWELIERAQRNGLPFDFVGADDLYGRSVWLRTQIDQAGLRYMLDVPKDTRVYLAQPEVSKPGTSASTSVRVDEVFASSSLQRIRIRRTERGILNDLFAARRVWVVPAGSGCLSHVWLVLRVERSGRRSYALSNAPTQTPLTQLADWKCRRALTECGYDDFCAQKFLAWQHHTALTILTTWFIAWLKFDWAKAYRHDPTLMTELEVDILPRLSVANVRALLQAALPIEHRTKDEAMALIVRHLINRTHSRKSRLRTHLVT
jgi:hypothetical protein